MPPASRNRRCRRLLREIGIKSCREVRFSHGGAFFAAANNAAVQVYGSYTAENVGNLRRVLRLPHAAGSQTLIQAPAMNTDVALPVAHRVLSLPSVGTYHRCLACRGHSGKVRSISWSPDDTRCCLWHTVSICACVVFTRSVTDLLCVVP